MNLASEPPIAVKIARMRQRLRWQADPLRRRGIDQTRLVLRNDPGGHGAFSFLVLGDSGTGHYRGDSPQRRVAERLLEHRREAAFLLHTGDVVYLVGSSEQYRENFIEPYREWLVGGEHWRSIPYDRMCFRQPFLPVPGNHDYYDLPAALGLLSGLSAPLRALLRPRFDLDVGWHGSFQGEAYARAFLDVLADLPEGAALERHLEKHYGARELGRRCLGYEPGSFTRLPNRYYGFRYAGVEVLALDSNTFHRPPRDGGRGGTRVEEIRRELRRLEQRRGELLRGMFMPEQDPDGSGAEPAYERMERLEQIEEQIRDLELQRAEGGDPGVDREQLVWLRERLVASWRDPGLRGRILLLHHAPYSTETSKWNQAQTLAVRQRLREVLDAVERQLGPERRPGPLVDLVLSGHAHCLELLHTLDTGHGDAGIPWLVCGGSGYSLRRQRSRGNELLENGAEGDRPVAVSRLFHGRSGRGRDLERPYSGVRVDVASGTGPLRISGTGLLAVRARDGWRQRDVPLPLAQG